MNKILIHVLIVMVVGAMAQQVCHWTNSANGDKYDLSGLRNLNTDYHLVKGSGSPPLQWDIWMNMCTAVVIPICGSGVSACQQWDPTTEGGHATLGEESTIAFEAASKASGDGGKGMVAKYLGGTDGRNYEIDMMCSVPAGIGMPTYYNEDPPLHYNFRWQSKFGCPLGSDGIPGDPTGGKISGGTIFLIIVASLVFIYFVGGIVFMKFVRKSSGKEIVPNVDFWISITGLCRDGALIIVNKVKRRGEYSQV